MLKCNCGWSGVNLKPDYQTNTAHCPMCNTTFKGIPAENAIYTLRDEEIKLQNRLEDDKMLFEELEKLR